MVGLHKWYCHISEYSLRPYFILKSHSVSRSIYNAHVRLVGYKPVYILFCKIISFHDFLTYISHIGNCKFENVLTILTYKMKFFATVSSVGGVIDPPASILKNSRPIESHLNMSSCKPSPSLFGSMKNRSGSIAKNNTGSTICIINNR